jgi:ABC-type multidrug transport system ATPase subunit
MPAIEIQKLQKSFEGQPVLHGVSLTANHGDIYGFLGPNGSGKTTTLRIPLGILTADEGKVAVLGMDPGRGIEHSGQRHHRQPGTGLATYPPDHHDLLFSGSPLVPACCPQED